MEAEIKIALAGNPNCGKTTLFNALTGSNQFVGNWPGVTVEKKEGRLKKHDGVVVTDLPGIYSLSPYTLEEVVARNYLIDERPDVILNIIDGTNLERNLYLTTQLTELGIPVVVAVNMMDVVRKNGDKIDVAELSRQLGCRVLEISALKGTGITEAAQAAVEAAKGAKTIPQHSFSGVVEHALAHIEEAAVHDMPEEQQRWYAVKIFERDEKVLEKINLEQSVLDHIEKDIQAAETELDDDAESIITNERYIYIASVIKGCYKKKNRGKLSTSDKIDKVVTNRFAALPIFAVVMILVYYISVTTVGTWVTDWTNDGLFGAEGAGWHLFGIGSAEYDKATENYGVENLFSQSEIGERLKLARDEEAKGDTNTVAVQTLYDDFASGSDFGAFSEDYEQYIEDADAQYAKAVGDDEESISELVDPVMENAPDPADYGVWVPGIATLADNGLEKIHCAEWLKSLVVDGIIGGVGAVLGFVPQMLVLFFFLAFLESCGYMARIAFVMDRIFRKFGLSGKSFIPMLIGSGCGVPGIMASRTIENERDRRMTIMTTTFIPCGAKLPIIAMISTALFGGAWWVAPSAYFLGVAAIVISGIMLKKTKRFAGDPAPFVMELPAYHLPTAGNIFRSMWERGYSFIKKAGTIILISSIIIWAGSSFGWIDGSFGYGVEELSDSILGYIGSGIQWIFAPLGFDNIRAVIATIMGLVAKEEVVGVFGVVDFADMTKLSAYAFLAFNLLCAPCFAAMGAIKREMNSAKWTAFAIGYQCVLAYGVSLVIFQIGSLFTGEANVIGVIAALLVIAVVIYMLFFKKYREADKLKIQVKTK